VWRFSLAALFSLDEGLFMSRLITVDPDRCTSCDHCVQECPVKIIERKEQSKIPSSRKVFKDWCINCGHCVAACPNGALALHNLDPEQCLSVQREILVAPEHFEHFVRSRRSIRTFKPESVAKDVLERLIDITRYTPTGSNRQTTQWLVVQDSAKVQELAGLVIDWMRNMLTEQTDKATLMGMSVMVKRWEAGLDVICRHAPNLIVAHADKHIGTPAADAHVALGTLELAAFSHGLGGCWCGYMDMAINAWPPLQELLGVPAGHRSFGVMLLGHPKFKYHRLPHRNEAQVRWV
jgi:nitroreductase/NAD-dependent dihydropyrimidine dehydrogenase PreA subunit